MKLFYLLLFLFISSFTACSQNSVNKSVLNTNISNLEKSKETWIKHKTASSNSYSYFTNFVSWSGFGHETEIKIENGIFTQRRFTSWNRTDEDTWLENQKNLGKHKVGAKLKLIDDLYKECKNILKTRSKLINNIYLSFDKKGLLSTCLYSPKNCADDCSNGIQIKEIKFLK
jgi:hypothetical protein